MENPVFWGFSGFGGFYPILHQVFGLFSGVFGVLMGQIISLSPAEDDRDGQKQNVRATKVTWANVLWTDLDIYNIVILKDYLRRNSQYQEQSSYDFFFSSSFFGVFVRDSTP